MELLLFVSAMDGERTLFFNEEKEFSIKILLHKNKLVLGKYGGWLSLYNWILILKHSERKLFINTRGNMDFILVF